MSWSVNLIGKKAAVAAEVTRQFIDCNNHPEIGTVLLKSIGMIPDPAPGIWGSDSVRILGTGHGGVIDSLVVESFTECSGASIETAAS